MGWVIFVLIGIGLVCRPAMGDTVAPLVPGVDSGVLIMAVTGEASKITPTKATITSEIFNRDRFVTVRVEYSDDSISWKRSVHKPLKQFRRESVKIKLEGLKPGTKYFYRVYAEGEVGTSLGTVMSFKTR